MISASMLYNYIECPHRPAMDKFGDQSKMDEVSPFVEMLWERGAVHEQMVVDGLKHKVDDFVDLSSVSDMDERERLTLAAMKEGRKLIYQGRIQHGDLLGMPDLLEEINGKYQAGDIKSGRGLEDPEEAGSYKSHYLVQICLYTEIIEGLGISAGRKGFVIDSNGARCEYDYAVVKNKKQEQTWWHYYSEVLSHVRNINSASSSKPAYSGSCKLCHWYTECKLVLVEGDDLTLIAELGRSRREAIIDTFKTVGDLAAADIGELIDSKGKTPFKGVGAVLLTAFKERADLQKSNNPEPYLKQRWSRPKIETALYFDIEDDPLRGFLYLHGFYVVKNDGTEPYYRAFIVNEVTPDEEKIAFSEAVAFIRDSAPCALFYYSAAEKTAYKKLSRKYPDVISESDVESLFEETNGAVDLYQVVKRYSVWPTYDLSLKSLASFVGFSWRDSDPSGAASIEWFDRWINGDSAYRERILEYNEDDCIATQYLEIALSKMDVRN